jgi:hypothetical protein
VIRNWIPQLTSSDTALPIMRYPAAPAMNEMTVAMIWKIRSEKATDHDCTDEGLVDHLEGSAALSIEYS